MTVYDSTFRSINTLTLLDQLKNIYNSVPPQVANVTPDGSESHETTRIRATTSHQPTTAPTESDTSTSTTTTQNGNPHTMVKRRYPKRATDQRKTNFNYYKHTSLIFHSEHGPGIICLACETSKYLLAQYTAKRPAMRMRDIQPLQQDDATDEESIKHYPSYPAPSTSTTLSLTSDMPDFIQSSCTDDVQTTEQPSGEQFPPTTDHTYAEIPSVAPPVEADDSDASTLTIEADRPGFIPGTDSDADGSENSVIIVDTVGPPPPPPAQVIDLTGDSDDQDAPPSRIYPWSAALLQSTAPSSHTFRELLTISTDDLTHQEIEFMMPIYKRKWAEEREDIWMRCFNKPYPYHSNLFD